MAGAGDIGCSLQKRGRLAGSEPEAPESWRLYCQELLIPVKLLDFKRLLFHPTPPSSPLLLPARPAGSFALMDILRVHLRPLAPPPFSSFFGGAIQSRVPSETLSTPHEPPYASASMLSMASLLALHCHDAFISACAKILEVVLGHSPNVFSSSSFPALSIACLLDRPLRGPSFL